MIAEFEGKRAYIDANVFIYALEGFPAYEAICREFLSALENGRIAGVTSELTLAEVLVHPLMHGRHDIAQAYRELLTQAPNLGLVPISREILEASAAIRAALRSRLPDAIHVATAKALACDALITGDKSMRVPPELAMVTLDSLVARNGKP